MYADRTQSRACREPISRRALAHLRAAAGLPRRKCGAQPGNRNRLMHGIYSRAFRARRERARALVRQSYELVAQVARAVRTRVHLSTPSILRQAQDQDLTKALILSLPTFAKATVGQRFQVVRRSPGVGGSKDEGRPRFHSIRHDTSLSPNRDRGRS